MAAKQPRQKRAKEEKAEGEAPAPQCACLPTASGPGVWWNDGFNNRFLPRPDGVGIYHLVWDSESGMTWAADNGGAVRLGLHEPPPA